MSENVIFKTREETLREERQYRELTAPKITAVDRQDYEMCLERFRDICKQVRDLTGIHDFRGGYDEWRAIAMDPTWNTNAALLLLSRQCDAINLETNYEASKLGIVSPNWWKECWKDELTQS